jgi:hypothetical protein
MRMTRRDPTLAEVAATAVLLASDHAGGTTGTFVNATGGMVSVRRSTEIVIRPLDKQETTGDSNSQGA